MGVIEFDIRGQICPATLLIALKEINKRSQEILEGNTKLLFMTDNRDAVITIPESAENMGYSVRVEKRDDCYVIEVGGG